MTIEFITRNINKNSDNGRQLRANKLKGEFENIIIILQWNCDFESVCSFVLGKIQKINFDHHERKKREKEKMEPKNNQEKLSNGWISESPE